MPIGLVVFLSEASMYKFLNFREIKRSLVSFLKASAKINAEYSERNPFWILCVPIVHFLEGSLQPFREMNYAEFRNKDTDWWIAPEFETEKDEIKIRKWSRYIYS